MSATDGSAREPEAAMPTGETGGPAAHIAGHCPHCRLHWRLRATHAGRQVKCRNCGGTFAAIDESSSATGPGVPGDIPGYEIEGELGHGGMGRVYRAREMATKRPVALKVMLEGRYADERQRRRFEREVELAAALEHPGIARIYASGLHAGHHWFAMEYVAGQRLDEYVAREQLGIRDILALFERICTAVNHAHQRGILHRDLKPGNILVDERAQPHVLDFGLAKVVDRFTVGAAGAAHRPEAVEEGISLAGEIAGTPAYMSPEQTKGDPALLDVRSDVYALGVILYRLLTGRSPYGTSAEGSFAALLRAIAETEPEPPRRIRKAIPDEVNAIVLKALEKDAERRYQTAGELGRDVEAYLAGDVVTAKRGSGWYTLRKTALRYKRLAGAIAAVVVLSLGLGLTFGTLWTTTRVELKEVTKERAVYRDRLVEAGLPTAIEPAKAAPPAEAPPADEGPRDAADRQVEAELRFWSALSKEDRTRFRRLVGDQSRQLGQERLLWVDPDAVRSCDLSPDGKWLVAGNDRGEMVVLDVSGARPARVVLTGDGAVSQLAYSTDGKQLVSLANGRVRTWDTRDWTVKHELPPQPDGYRCLALSRKDVLAVGTSAKGVSLHDLRTGRIIEEPGGVGEPDAVPYPYLLKFSPDGRDLIGWFRPMKPLEEGWYAIWPVTSRGARRRIGRAGGSAVGWAVVFTPDGSQLVVGYAWNLMRHKLMDYPAAVEVISAPGGYLSTSALALSRDGELIAAGDQCGSVFVWRLSDWSLLHTFRGHTGAVTGVCFLSDDSALVSTAEDGCVRLWRLGDPPAATVLLQAEVGGLTYTSDGRDLISCSSTERLRITDVRTHQVLRQDRATHTRTVAVSPDGRLVAASSTGRPVAGGVRTEVVIFPFEGEQGAVTLETQQRGAARLIFSSDSKLLAGFLLDGSIVAWDTGDGRVIASFEAQHGPAWPLRFTGADLLEVFELGTGRLVSWSIRRNERQVLREGLPITAGEVECSPDGRWLIVSRGGRTCAIHSMQTGEQLSVIHADDEPICRYAISPDSRLLATGHARGAIRLWELPSGAFVGQLEGHTAWVDALCFAPDQRWLASAGNEGKVRLWPLDVPAERSAEARAVGLRLVVRDALQRGEYQYALDFAARMPDKEERAGLLEFAARYAAHWLNDGQVERAAEFGRRIRPLLIAQVPLNFATRGLGALLLVAGRTEEAATWYERAAGDPDRSDAPALWARAGWAAMLSGNADRAKSAFEKALGGQEADRDLLLRFAEFVLGRIDADKFKAASPGLAWFYLGEHALGQGKIEEARLAYMRCLAVSQATWACDWAAWRLQQLRARLRR